VRAVTYRRGRAASGVALDAAARFLNGDAGAFDYRGARGGEHLVAGLDAALDHHDALHVITRAEFHLAPHDDAVLDDEHRGVTAAAANRGDGHDDDAFLALADHLSAGELAGDHVAVAVGQLDVDPHLTSLCVRHWIHACDAAPDGPAGICVEREGDRLVHTRAPGRAQRYAAGAPE